MLLGMYLNAREFQLDQRVSPQLAGVRHRDEGFIRGELCTVLPPFPS